MPAFPDFRLQRQSFSFCTRTYTCLSMNCVQIQLQISKEIKEIKNLILFFSSYFIIIAIKYFDTGVTIYRGPYVSIFTDVTVINSSPLLHVHIRPTTQSSPVHHLTTTSFVCLVCQFWFQWIIINKLLKFKQIFIMILVVMNCMVPFIYPGTLM